MSTYFIEKKSQHSIFFQDACKSFFGLDINMKDDHKDTSAPPHVDPYWNISSDEIYKGLYEAFEQNWQRYIPNISIPQGESFLSYAEKLHQTKCVMSINPIKAKSNNAVKLPNVGLVGIMHSGKSTVAEYLCQSKGYTEYSFAQPLKEGIRRLFSFHPEQVYTELKEKVDVCWGVSPRYILQQIGTNLFRKDLHLYIPNLKIKESIWIENFLRWSMKNAEQNVVVSDCRFVDESLALQKCGFQLLRIIRPSLMVDHKINTHASEVEQERIKVDVDLVNNGTKDELFVKVEKFIK